MIEVGTVCILLNISEVFWAKIPAKIIASATIGNKFYKPGLGLCSGGTIILGPGGGISGKTFPRAKIENNLALPFFLDCG